MSASLYTMHRLDVWGNATDGWDTNDVLPSEGDVILDDDWDARDVIAALVRAGFLSDSATSRDLDVDLNEPGSDVFLRDDTDDDEGAGRPLATLRYVRDIPAGYVDCACRGCFEGPVIGYPGLTMCDGCEASGCELGDHDCGNPHAYGGVDGTGHCGDLDCCGDPDPETEE